MLMLIANFSLKTSSIILQDCNEDCVVELFAEKGWDGRMLLRHNTNGRHNDDHIPVKSGTVVYGDQNGFSCPPDATWGGAADMGKKIESAKSELCKQYRSIKCPLAGAHVAESNFRNCLAKAVCSAKLKDKFIDIMAVIAAGELDELITYTQW